MKYKLIFVNPVNSEDTFAILNPNSSKNNSTAFVAPLGVGYLAAQTPENWDISLIDENIAPFEFVYGDLVAITAHTGQAARAFEIAQVYKDHNVPVIIGGIHASFLPDEAYNYADCVVTGEAEEIWPDILNDFTNGNLKKRYDAGLANINLDIKPLRSIYSKKYKIGSITTSRGCPIGCDFCTINIFNGGKIRRRPAKFVADELEEIPQKYLFVVDDNLFGYTAEDIEGAKELFREIISRKIKKRWVCQTSINSLQDEELLKLARKAGCMGIFIGMESVNKEILIRMKKTANIDMGTDSYNEIIRKVNRHSIAVMGQFVTGYEKNIEEIKQETDWMKNSPADIVNFAILTPFPGTKMYEVLQEQNRLLIDNYPNDWKYYTKDYPVFKMDYLTFEELYEGLKYRVETVYNLRIIFSRFIKTLLRTRSFQTSIIALFVNIFWSRRKNIKRLAIFETFKSDSQYMNRINQSKKEEIPV